MVKRKTGRILKLPAYFQSFVSLETLSGIILLLSSALALFLSNSSLSDHYNNFFATQIGITIGTFQIYHSLDHWINEGLMTVFFFVIGLEIKREILYGELSSRAKIMLPVAAAFGGAVVPSLIYFMFNKGTAGAQGWGIPMATDIAFVLGIIAMLGNRVPKAIKIFVLAFAIIDDLIAIIVIAVFYSNEVNIGALVLGCAIIAAGVVLKKYGIYQTFVFLMIGVGSWFAILESGIHPTITGVAMAITIPTIHKGAVNGSTESPLNRLVHTLHPVSSFFIMPVFALANAGIKVDKDIFNSLLHPVSLGVISGLFIGKPVGIFVSIWASVKLKWAALPSGTKWRHIIATACMGGMGFTLSLFISVLAFSGQEELQFAKYGVLAGSLVSVVTGSALFILNKRAA